MAVQTYLKLKYQKTGMEISTNKSFGFLSYASSMSIEKSRYEKGMAFDPSLAKKEKIVFDIELPRSAQLYNALHDGKDPKTHEEYMKEVVGQIKLPKLPPGKVYRYHPETNELWVESEKPTEPSKP